jgi:hypothetical protein
MRSHQPDPSGLDYRRAEEASAAWLRNYAHRHGGTIYRFMDRYGIGKSAYGALMDRAAAGKHVIRHRLFGHHIAYDLPWDGPTHIPSFLEHELSDLFTKQGLPILPGELLEHHGLLKYCDGLGKSWNFLNGFDILAGVVALHSASSSARAAFNGEFAVDTLADFARTFGVGVVEFALAWSSANPLLLLSATMELTAAVRAFANDSCVIFMSSQQAGLHIDFSLDAALVETAMERYEIGTALAEHGLEESLRKASRMTWE